MSLITENDVFEFMKEVQEKVDYLDRYTKVIRDQNIPTTVLNYVSANFPGLNSWLLKVYEAECVRDMGLKQDYKIQWSEWLIAVSTELNQSRIKSKYASASEIEAHTIVKNKEEYRKWQRDLIMSEKRVSMYRRLKDDLEDTLKIIIALNANSRSEMKSLSVEGVSQRLVEREKKIKIKKQQEEQET